MYIKLVYKIQLIVTENRSVVAWILRVEGEGLQTGIRKYLGMMAMFSILTAEMVLQVCVYIKTHHTAHFKYMQFILCPLLLNKAGNAKRVHSNVPKSRTTH